MSTKVMEYDLAVIGAGGSALIAAVKAAEVSGKKVIVLEKAKKPGGATIFGHGMSIKDSKWQKANGEAISDPPDISGQFFDWIVEKGGAEKYFKIAKPVGTNPMMGSISMPARIDKYKDHPDPSIGPGWMGSYFVDKMLECCEKMQIPVLTETRATKIITDAGGRIAGILADTRDGQLLINCKACYIGSGGFGADYEKCRRLQPDDFNNKTLLCLAPPSLTGDGIDMAEEIGAAIDMKSTWVVVEGPVHHPYSYTIYRLMMQSEMVDVNLNGERFMDESAFMSRGKRVLAAQPKAQLYAIFDNDLVEMLGEKLIKNPSEESDVPILQKFREDIAYEVSLDEGGANGDHTKKADTLIELALKMDLDPKTFVATIERYNKFCDSGQDTDFGKKVEYLKAVRKPPFYAFFGQRFSQCSHGGISVNEDGEVLDTRGRVIPGLFAGGDCTTIFTTGGNSQAGAVPGTPAGGQGQAGGQSGATGGAPGGGGPGSKPGAFGSGTGKSGGGFTGAITSGYTGGITAGKYLAGI